MNFRRVSGFPRIESSSNSTALDSNGTSDSLAIVYEIVAACAGGGGKFRVRENHFFVGGVASAAPICFEAEAVHPSAAVGRLSCPHPVKIALLIELPGSAATVHDLRSPMIVDRRNCECKCDDSCQDYSIQHRTQNKSSR